MGYKSGYVGIIGKANAAVFPVPVCAQPKMSLPCNIAGIARCWIGDGF